MEVLLFNLHMTTLLSLQIIENCVNKCLELLHERDYGSNDNIGIYFR